MILPFINGKAIPTTQPGLPRNEKRPVALATSLTFNPAFPARAGVRRQYPTRPLTESYPVIKCWLTAASPAARGVRFSELR